MDMGKKMNLITNKVKVVTQKCGRTLKEKVHESLVSTIANEKTVRGAGKGSIESTRAQDIRTKD